MPEIALLMGSKSDLPKLQDTIQVFKDFGIDFTVRVMSAHRTPEVVVDFTVNAESNGIKVIICAAGSAAHLAGVVAGHTTLPVLGIPVQGGALNGMDALLATVQMPGGIPVASVAVGGGGPKNAGLFAVQILALSNPELAQKLKDSRKMQSDKVMHADEELQDELRS